MAEISGVVTWGLGPTTGSDIEHFLLLGLNLVPPGFPLTGLLSIEHWLTGEVSAEPYLTGSLAAEPYLTGSLSVET